MKQRIKHLCYIIILIIIDQLSKIWSINYLAKDGPITIIRNVLKLQYHENDGAVWGLMSGQRVFLIPITILILIGLIYVYFKIPNAPKFTLLKGLFIFIMAGAVGNLIDRVYLGYVVDFIYFELINFPIFNIADSYLTVSSFLLVILGIFYYKEEDLVFLDEMITLKKRKNAKNDDKHQ